MKNFLTALFLCVGLQAAVVNPPSGGGSGGSSTNALGTDGTLAKFTGTNALRNSIVTQQGTTNITVVGTLAVGTSGQMVLRASGLDTNDLSIAIGTAGTGNGATNTGNVAIGSGALGGLTTGNSNLGIGKNAGAGITTGIDNTLVGTSSGGSGSSSMNTGIGKRALSASTTSSNNVAIGAGASSGSIAGSGAGITTGDGNIIIGYAAGGVTTGNRNVLIGDELTAASASADNTLDIMNAIFGTGLDGTGTTIQAAGKIGIMTNAPGFTLDVSGTIGLNGTALPSGSGTAGYVSIWDSASVLIAGPFRQSGVYWIPGTNDQVFIGSSTNRLAGLSSVLGNFSGLLTASGGLTSSTGLFSGSVVGKGVSGSSSASVAFGFGTTRHGFYRPGAVTHDLQLSLDDTGSCYWNQTDIGLRNDGQYSFSSTSGADGTKDLGLSRVVAGVARFQNGVSTTNGWFQWAGQTRVSTQFDATTTTLGDVTGLAVSVKAGRTYAFTATLDTTLDVTGGGKYAIGGSATATAINYRVQHLGASLAMLGSTRQTSLGSSVNATATLTDDQVIITGTITVNAAGTLTVQFAQQSANATSSVLVGSSFMVFDCP